MLNTSRRTIPYPNPDRSDRPDIPLHIKNLVDKLDVDMIYDQGTDAARIAAAHQAGGGRIWWTTDTHLFWYDDGAAWWTVQSADRIPVTIVDAKGDLIVATGADAVVRKAVGTDGRRLGADSSIADGLSWVLADFPVGAGCDWPWIASQVPANFALVYGQNLSRASYPVLHAIASASSYPHGAGDGSTTFGVPDYRGRAGFGKDDMGGSAANRITNAGSGIVGTTLGASGGAETVTLTSGQMPAHTHTITDPGHTHANTLTMPAHSHAHTLTMPAHTHAHALTLPAHTHAHTLTLPNHIHTTTWSATIVQSGTGKTTVATTGTMDTTVNTSDPTTSPAITGSITNSGTPAIGGTITATAGTEGITGAISNSATPAIGGAITSATTGITATNTGGGTAHNTMPPALIVNKIMRVS